MGIANNSMFITTKDVDVCFWTKKSIRKYPLLQFFDKFSIFALKILLI